MRADICVFCAHSSRCHDTNAMSTHRHHRHYRIGGYDAFYTTCLCLCTCISTKTTKHKTNTWIYVRSIGPRPSLGLELKMKNGKKEVNCHREREREINAARDEDKGKRKWKIPPIVKLSVAACFFYDIRYNIILPLLCVNRILTVFRKSHEKETQQTHTRK